MIGMSGRRRLQGRQGRVKAHCFTSGLTRMYWFLLVCEKVTDRKTPHHTVKRMGYLIYTN
jgi:hypothetical protein